MVLALGVSAVFYQLSSSAGTRNKANVATKNVVVASNPLVLGTTIKSTDLKIIAWPAETVPPGVYTKIEEVVDRVAVGGILVNEPVAEGRLAPRGSGLGLSPLIPSGMRAVSVRVNDVIGVAGYVLPGTRVDVVATVSPTNQDTDMTSKVVLTNVLVLAAGTRIEQDAEQNKPVSVSVVTLLVDPVEAERLTLASTEGKIQLALRNPLDKTAPQTPGIRPAALLGFMAPARTVAARPTPPSPPPPPPTVEVIRGDKRAQEVVHQ